MAIPLAIPLIMSAAGLATKIGSGIAGGKQMSQYQQSLEKEKAGLDAWYNVERNRDWMESDVARSAMNKVLENIEEQNRIADSAAEVTGATDAAKIATKAKNQKRLGDVVKDLAAMGTQRGDMLDRTYRTDRSRLMGMERDLYAGRARNLASLGSAGGDLIGAAAPLFGETKWGALSGEDVLDAAGETLAGDDPTQIT